MKRLDRKLTHIQIEQGRILPPGKLRNKGGGRKRAEFHDPGIVEAIEGLVETETRGDPESPLKWVCKSTRDNRQGIFTRP